MDTHAVAARHAEAVLHVAADRLWLDDGRSVVLQPVGPQDAEAEQGFVRALSPASRVRRFHFGMRELARMMALVRLHGGHFVRHPGDATLARARFEL